MPPFPMGQPSLRSMASSPSAVATATPSAGSDLLDDQWTSSLTSGLAGLVLVWYVVMWAISGLGLSVAIRRYRPRPVAPPLDTPTPKPGVSILRPLKGLDPNLYENLLSSFTQDYPGPLEIIFSLADENDRALGVVRELIDRFGAREGREDGVDVRVVVGETPLGPNPKINNLAKPFALAKYDHLWVLDSGILLPSRQTLSRAIDQFLLNPGPSSSVSSTSYLPSSGHKTEKQRVGLVHHVPFAVIPPRGNRPLGSWLERVFLNGNHAKMYLAINKLSTSSSSSSSLMCNRRTNPDELTDATFWDSKLKPSYRTELDSCVMGKSNFYLKSDVQKIIPGRKPPNPASNPPPILGLASFSPYLAEDNMLALSLMHQLSIRHSIETPDVAINLIGPMTFRDYFWRRVRWIRVRKEMTKAATLVEPLTESVVLGFLTFWALRTYLSESFFGNLVWWKAFLAFWIIHWTSWATLDWKVMTSLSPTPSEESGERFQLLGAWMIRECLAFPVWVVAMMGNTVEWRGRTYVVLPDGKAKEVQNGDGNGVEEVEAGERSTMFAWFRSRRRQQAQGLGYERISSS
ncbi:Ceramide glucosyltransferase [Phaffia rhodozyma]|uniref:Ceramide glucosyltransferase n=1 Tax=Phaffia rhodozyma TaxID=264483 RepID=A0A0F7SHC4_PHARH|nr:Ceramide glucosyltransferase [Phaffia rhodozyma]